jgi:hypothetical protein
VKETTATAEIGVNSKSKKKFTSSEINWYPLMHATKVHWNFVGAAS